MERHVHSFSEDRAVAVAMYHVNRYRIWLFLVLVAAIICFWVEWTLSSGYKMDYEVSDVTAIHIHNSSNQTDHFPPKFHQTWFGFSPMPHAWNRTIRLSIGVNHNIQYIRWSNDDVEQLLSREYPWFLETYRSYPYPVQRTDAARYFILHQYGGFYMDMDIRATVSFLDIVKKENLGHYDCILPKTQPYGVSNDMMLCKGGSPFMGFVTSELKRRNHGYILPFVTVMASTGPLFLTWCLDSYIAKHEVFILPNKLYTQDYFHHIHGSTWHGWDAKVIAKIYGVFTHRHRVIILFVVILSTVLLFFVLAIYKGRFRGHDYIHRAT
jgi:mannosyltransferase OCH1-like enzyme